MKITTENREIIIIETDIAEQDEETGLWRNVLWELEIEQAIHLIDTLCGILNYTPTQRVIE